tara:strand:- start:33 stop:401 length:369 start_codon:yes stop_codon:yes gene_type:complete
MKTDTQENHTKEKFVSIAVVVSVKLTLKTKQNTIYKEFMPKMRKFLFWNETGEEKETEQLSLKKAIMSVQSNFKDRLIGVKYISKKGKEMCHGILIPIGRKIKQELVKERRREALKAKHASR